MYISHVNVTQTVPDISPLMPMHQDPLLVTYFDINGYSTNESDMGLYPCNLYQGAYWNSFIYMSDKFWNFKPEHVWYPTSKESFKHNYKKSTVQSGH